jgi:hypothetical protein
MQQQFGLADPLPAVEQNELGRPWALASSNSVEKANSCSRSTNITTSTYKPRLMYYTEPVAYMPTCTHSRLARTVSAPTLVSILTRWRAAHLAAHDGRIAPVPDALPGQVVRGLQPARKPDRPRKVI